MSSTIYNDSSTVLQHRNASWVRQFLKTLFFSYTDPVLEEKKRIKKLKLKIKNDPIAQLYLFRNLSFSKQFIITLCSLHSYMQAFREHLSFQPFFDISQFPLFLLEKFSTPKQMEWYRCLLDPNTIKDNIKKNGLGETKHSLKSIFQEYKSSFSDQQIYEIHRILDLGTGFYSFLQLNLEGLIIMLYPHYQDDPTLELIDQFYQPMKIARITQELETVIAHLSAIKQMHNYYDFIQYYSEYHGIKIISQKEFQLFFDSIQSLIKNNFLLDILQLEETNTLIQPILNIDIPAKNDMTHIVSEVSHKTKKNHKYAVGLFVQEGELEVLEYMFDKQTVQQIKNQQKKFDEHLSRSPYEKSALSISVVLLAFYEKIFNKSIQPTLEFLLKHTIFVIPNFKQDFLYYKDLMSRNYSSIRETIKEAKEAMLSQTYLSTVEITARHHCKDFLYNSANFNNILQVISTTGEKELKTKFHLTVSKDKMEKLLKNILISRDLVEKMRSYSVLQLTKREIF